MEPNFVMINNEQPQRDDVDMNNESHQISVRYPFRSPVDFMTEALQRHLKEVNQQQGALTKFFSGVKNTLTIPNKKKIMGN